MRIETKNRVCECAAATPLVRDRCCQNAAPRSRLFARCIVGLGVHRTSRAVNAAGEKTTTPRRATGRVGFDCQARVGGEWVLPR